MENNEQEKISGIIYILKNKTDGKIYVGQTIRALNQRILEYKRDFKFNKMHNNYLSNAFNKYGWNNFEFIIIDTANSIKELNEKEIKYISEYKSTDRDLGYNMELGGRNSKPNSETLEKMSISHSGIKQTDEWITNRISKAGSDEAKKYGKEKTDEEKTYLSENSPKYWQGKTRDLETKEKISKTKLKNGMSQKQIESECKTVYRINLITKEIEIFQSTKIAIISENVHQATISRWCLKNKLINNILWTYDKNETEKI